nr:NB-ARC domains-containing protein [Tanacetum cinerariifolium]
MNPEQHQASPGRSPNEVAMVATTEAVEVLVLSLENLSQKITIQKTLWHGCPFKYLPSDFYPQQHKKIWTTPKCFRRLKVVKLRLVYDRFRGFGTCVVFKCKKPFSTFEGYFVKNFDGAFLKKVYMDMGGNHESYMIWLHYRRDTKKWKEANNFVTFGFKENNELEVKEVGARLVFEEDLEQEADLSMLQGLPTPTQHGGILSLNGVNGYIGRSW